MNSIIPWHRLSKFGIIGLICILAGNTINCMLIPKKWQSKSSSQIEPTKSEDFHIEKDTVLQIRQELNDGQYENVLQKSTEFISKYPQSQFLNETLYMQGLSLETKDEWDTAINNYQKIIDLSLESNKEFLALSLYRKSICHESKGEYEMALASLFDALNYKAYLPLEVAEAEIPARMASIYAILKQTTQADYYTLVAEKGIHKARLIKKNNGSQDWLAYSLLQMGSLSLGNLTADSFYENILSFSRHQKYLLQAIELKDPKWSNKAEEILIGSYNNFWNTIHSYNINPTADWELDFVTRSDRQVEMASQLLESLELLKSYQYPEETEQASATLTCFEKLRPVENNAQALVQNQILLKPDKKLKPSIMSGSFETAKFEDEVPANVVQKFPKKNEAESNLEPENKIASKKKAGTKKSRSSKSRKRTK